MEQIRDIVKKHDLYLFADEVYREYIYTDEPYTSAMHLEGIENNVILVPRSKRGRLAGRVTLLLRNCVRKGIQ